MKTYFRLLILMLGVMVSFVACSGDKGNGPETEVSRDTIIAIPQLTATECNAVSVPVLAANLNGIAGIEIHIGFDTLATEFDTLMSDYLSNPITNVSDGQLHIIWADMSMQNPLSIADEDTLMTIRFLNLDGLCPLDIAGLEISDTAAQVLDIITENGSMECVSE